MLYIPKSTIVQLNKKFPGNKSSLIGEELIVSFDRKTKEPGELVSAFAETILEPYKEGVDDFYAAIDFVKFTDNHVIISGISAIEDLDLEIDSDVVFEDEDQEFSADPELLDFEDVVTKHNEIPFDAVELEEQPGVVKIGNMSFEQAGHDRVVVHPELVEFIVSEREDGKTLSALAGAIGVSRDTISRFKDSGKKVIATIPVVTKIVEYYNK